MESLENMFETNRFMKCCLNYYNFCSETVYGWRVLRFSVAYYQGRIQKLGLGGHHCRTCLERDTEGNGGVGLGASCILSYKPFGGTYFFNELYATIS